MKTAVEWLAEQVNSAKWKFADVTDRNSIIEQAKEMEKEQMIDIAYQVKHSSYFIEYSKETPDKIVNDYYNKTFKK